MAQNERTRSESGPATEPPRLAAADIRQRKAFLEFGEDDVALLKELGTLTAGEIPSLVEEFYVHLLAFPELRALLRDEARLARLKQTQAAYFEGLTGGDYGAAYVEDRLRVGGAHRRVGLDPKWYLGAYAKYIALLLPRIQARSGENGRKALAMTRALLKIVFLDLGLAIDTYILADRQAIGQKAAQLAALNQVAIAISSTLGLREVLERIMGSATALTGAAAACIAFYDPDARRFEEWYTQGLSERFVKNISFRPGGLAEEAFASGAYVLSNDRPGTRHKLSALAHEEGIASFACLPLTSRTQPLGVFYVYRRDRDSFLTEEIDLLTTLAHLAAGAIETARLYTKTATLAATDTLTGLLNRRTLNERLESEIRRCRRYGRPFSLLMIDVDHFKEINDAHGHVAGDAVLKALSARLLGQTRDVDSVGRYGGEEFLIILPETEGGGPVGERIREAVANTPFRLPDGREIRVTISIGIASFAGDADAPTLIERADRALYAAKRDGRNRSCVAV